MVNVDDWGVPHIEHMLLPLYKSGHLFKNNTKDESYINGWVFNGLTDEIIRYKIIMLFNYKMKSNKHLFYTHDKLNIFSI